MSRFVLVLLTLVALAACSSEPTPEEQGMLYCRQGQQLVACPDDLPWSN